MPGKTKPAQAENRKKILLLSGIGFALIVMILFFVWLIEVPKTGKIEVVVAPTSAEILIGGKPFRNGTYRIEPGAYDVEITKDGFEKYADQITVTKDATTPLMVCLAKNEGNDEYYAANEEDQKVCYTVEEYLAEKLEEEKFGSEEIFNVAPYHSYEKGFYIDPYFDENDKVHIKITLVTCSAERAEGLKQNALEWLKNQNVNLDKYALEYSSCAYGD